MAFEVPPTPLRRRALLPMLGLVASVIAVVVLALATSNSPRVASLATPSPPAAAAIEVPAAAPGDGPSVGSDTAHGAPTLPPANSIDCHDLAAAACGDVVRASIATLPDDLPPISSIGVWSTLLCGDDLDCPRQRLERYQPLGSAVIAFGPARLEAWVDVIEPAGPSGPMSDSAQLVAWITRWQH